MAGVRWWGHLTVSPKAWDWAPVARFLNVWVHRRAMLVPRPSCHGMTHRIMIDYYRAHVIPPRGAHVGHHGRPPRYDNSDHPLILGGDCHTTENAPLTSARCGRLALSRVVIRGDRRRGDAYLAGVHRSDDSYRGRAASTGVGHRSPMVGQWGHVHLAGSPGGLGGMASRSATRSARADVPSPEGCAMLTCSDTGSLAGHWELTALVDEWLHP